MSLLLAKLENVRRVGNKTTAACPACREEGADRSGNHLVVFEDGRFGCAVNPKDKAHRQRIWSLAGDPASLPQGVDFGKITIHQRAAGKIKTGKRVTFSVLPATGRSDTGPSSPGTDETDETRSTRNSVPLPQTAPAPEPCNNYNYLDKSTANTPKSHIDRYFGSGLFDRTEGSEEKNQQDGNSAVPSVPEQDSPLDKKTGVASVPAHQKIWENPESCVACVPEPIVCTSRDDLDRIAADLAGADSIALDVETYGDRKGDALDPWRGDIRLLTVRRADGVIWIVDLMSVGYDLGPLAAVLAESTIIAHNAKFDLHWLQVKCGIRSSKVSCTLTASRLLAAGTKPGNNLDQCLERFLGIKPENDESRSDWGAMLLMPEQFDYAARDVAHLHDLRARMESEIESAGLGKVWAMESTLLPRVVDMEASGIRVDCEQMKAIALAANTEAGSTRGRLCEALGNPSLNPNSPAQLLPVLRKAGLVLESTSEEALKAADDGVIIPLVLGYRGAIKRAQQAETLIGHVQSDGRIHARFEPTGTATGRFSSKTPNLQNIGRGKMREAFLAEPGHCLVVADYSQVELRAAAAIAGESRMIDAYQSGEDLHRKTAATVLGIDQKDVGKSERQLAKAVNFGLLYGQSAPGLVRYAASSYGVTLAMDEAREIRTAFFRAYPKLRRWHDQCRSQARRGVSEVRTRLGRRRLIPDFASDWERFTALVNTPVQGACADGMKQAILTLAERLPEEARILSTVHDEVIVEASETEAEVVRDLVIECMEQAMAALFPEVPIEVEANVCNHWGEK